jgi:structure-specific recognition protein 1
MAEKGVAWKVLDGETQVQIPAGDIKWAQWLRVARKFQLRIGCVTKKDGVSDTRRETFDGFARDDFDKISQIFTQSYEVTLETKDVIFKGWNWGATDFQGASTWPKSFL